MASRKMTFSLPKELAARLLRRVPARERSRYVAEALIEKLKQREQNLARACDLANRVRGARAVEKDWEALADEIAEPWDDSSAG